MLRLERCLGFAAAALGLWGLVTGCGGSGKADSFGSITDEISKPTGTVDESTAGKVGEKFEAASKSSAQGVRDDDQTAASGSATITTSCSAGGSITISGSGNQSSGKATTKFDKCCFTEGCCTSGNGTSYYSSDQSAAYQYCASYDLDYSCEGTSASLEYQGCFGAGKAVFLIDVDGDSYAVSGSRSGGSGTLEITGANGKWTCTFSSGSGSCSSTSGSSFSFSKG
ncbi:MAG TPA: hypothetical protein VFS67_09085 [Polyangiaceae bacterium]|jgi:hypothetical protein|nr:hypothetical protein [Polyangiaceae bacterium]